MSNEKQYPAPDDLKSELEQYLAGPEAEANAQKLENVQTTKATLEELGVEVPLQLQEQIDGLKAKNPLNKLPKWATKNEWIKVLESRKQSLQAALKGLGDVKPAMRSELEAEIQRIDEKLTMPNDDLGGASRAEYAKSIRQVVGLKDETEKSERILTPEQIKKLMPILEDRFNKNQKRHEVVEWLKVKSSLEANPEALWSLNEMEKAGHEPDVYFADEKGFDVGTCCKESPEKHRNIVYDAEAAEWLRKNRPDEKFNGSAVEIAQAMGIDPMGPDKYKNELQAHGEYDTETSSYLKTSSDIRKDGAALRGYRAGDAVYVDQRDAYGRSDDRAFRGSLRVLWS